MAVGVAATAYGLFTPGHDVNFGAHENTLRVQGSFIQNFMYFNGAAQGGFLMTMIGVTTYARWTRRFKRIAEGLTQNARGLTALAEVLSDSNIHIETMIKVDNLKDYRATEK